MSRIGDRFSKLREEGRKGFVPFITAGDPDLETSLRIMLSLAELGADVIELGVPFSDPMADGPTIQRASQRALGKGVNLPSVLQLVRDARRRIDTPIVLFSYFNPLLRFGIERLAIEASDAGIDGVLVTDIVDDEAAAVSDALSGRGIDLISLIAPTTTEERLKTIARNSSGFLYAVSRAGVTGAQASTSEAAEVLVARARAVTDLPVAIGFGISTREQIEQTWRYADAAVVGSAIVTEIERSSKEQAVESVERFVRALLPEVAKSKAEL